MSNKRKPYNTYTKKFKLKALLMMDQSDRPESEVVMKLGIRRNQLYKWKGQLEKKAG
jgi:transposase